jgi:hypothetical protein
MFGEFCDRHPSDALECICAKPAGWRDAGKDDAETLTEIVKILLY